MPNISVKIDVKKIDKTKLFQGKNGALYLDVVLIENRDGEDQYGNSHMVVQSSTKEERAAGKRGAILGNAKTFGQQRSQPRTQQQNRSAQSAAGAPDGPPDEDSQVPF